MLKLILSIKRATFRDNDPRAARANAEYEAKRPAALARGRYTCQACGYTTTETNRNMDIHHKDDNHHNNNDDNLVCACHMCHPYQHVGQAGLSTTPAESMGKKTLIASIKELSASDLNLLQRAIGAALLDPTEAPIAEEILKTLVMRADPVKDDFGTWSPGDFAAAMARLTPEEYASREEVIQDLRLIFKKSELLRFGRELLADNPSMPVASWAAIERSVLARKTARSPT